MTCIDCCYCLLKDGDIICTCKEGECVKIRVLEEQLTKAKEIIKGLLNVFVDDIAEEDLDVGQIDFREKVYKFLKEVENGNK